MVKSPGRCSHRCGRVTLQVLMRGTPFDHRCGRVAWQGLKKKGGGFSGTALGHRPQNRAKKGADPRTGTPLRRKVFLPWCPVSSLSWPACAGAFLVPGRWFSGSAPSGSCLFWFRLMFLSTGRGRRVPAPSGRDVGSSAGAPTQEPVQGADPRTGFHRYPSTYDSAVYLVALVLYFPFCFAILFVVVLELCSLFPSLLQLRLVKLLRSRWSPHCTTSNHSRFYGMDCC